MTKSIGIGIIALCVLFGTLQSAHTATINYSGRVFKNPYINLNTPLEEAFVIVGTFAPGFAPHSYNFVYGDTSGNQNEFAYPMAVSDGNFIPLGSGTFTDADGNYSASVETSLPEGTPIWQFVLKGDDNDPTDDALPQSQILASSLIWQIPAQPDGTIDLVATHADMFIMGGPHPLGISVSVPPFPEPRTVTMGALALASVICWRGTQWRRLLRAKPVGR